MTTDLGERVFTYLDEIDGVELDPDQYDADAGYHVQIHDSDDTSLLDLSLAVDAYDGDVVKGTVMYDPIFELDRSDLAAVTTNDFTYDLLEKYAQRLNNAMAASNNLPGVSVELFDEEQILEVHDPTSPYLVVGTVEMDDTVRKEELGQLVSKVEFAQERIDSWYDTLKA